MKPSSRILAVLAILSLVPFACCQCSRTSANTRSAPTFLCSLNVTVARQSDCSARISETLVFPHTTADAERRVIQAVPIQQVSDIALLRNGQPRSITSKLEADGTVVVTLPTDPSPNPTTFVLSYKVSDAVMRFTDGCGNGIANPANNVLRWRTGPLGRVVDLLTVSFATTPDKSLSIIGGGGSEGPRISVTEADFDEEPDFSVEEAGGRLCPVDQVCFTRAMPIWQIALIGAMIGVPVILTGTCIFVFVFCDLCGIRSEVAGDEPIDESEMVGFRHGRYSTCIPNDDGFGGCECKKEREVFDIE